MKKGKVVILACVVLVGWWWVISGRTGAGTGTLRVWTTWGDDPAQLQAIFDRYAEASGRPVRVRAGLSADRILRAMRGSKPPDVVILSTSDPVGSYHRQGLVEPLIPWIESAGVDLDDVYAAPLAPCETPDGGYACLPWGCDVDALFWNKDLFAAAGLDPERPPQTMEELVEVAEALTLRDQSGELIRVGFIPDFPRSHGSLYARMYGADGADIGVDSQLASDDSSWMRQFDDLYGQEEIETFVSSFTPYLTSRHALFAGRRLSCRQCHRTAPARKDKLPDTGFYTGKVAMMVDGQWQVGADGLHSFQPDLNYGVALFPPPEDHLESARASVVDGPVVLIPAAARDKTASAELLAWMMSPEVVVELASTHGSLPTSRAAAQDPRFREDAELAVFMDLLSRR
jgi:ABC-type glycerol-3-phosphate transport system substrate-binding protein